jgi:hypothetical protein
VSRLSAIEKLEAVAYEAMMMFYYNNVSVNECWLPTARTRTSVYNIAKTIGYKPSQASQANVTLRFYVANSHDVNITIPKYTVCLTTSGKKFYTLADKILHSGEIYVDVDAKSGSINNDNIISTGIANYRYKLINNNVNSIIDVKVDDVEYTYTSFIDLADSKGHYYTVDYDSDNFAYIAFGDGTYGVNPGKNLVIDVVYITGAGLDDNVDSYTITTVNTVLYDDDNTIVNDMSVINNEYANGGSNIESLDEIKRNAPSLYRTQQRSVIPQDFSDLSLMVNGINKVSVIDNEVMSEVGIFGVKLCIVPDNGGYPSDAFKKEILSYFKEKKIVATQVEIVDPSYITFDATIGVKVSPTTSSSIVSNKIRSLVMNYLLWTNRELGQSVSKQDIYELVSGVSGVLSINTISLDEKRYIYVKSTPTVGGNEIELSDNMHVLSQGSKISIIGVDNTTTIAKVKTIADNGIRFTLSNTDDTDFVFTSSMNIQSNCFIYPILLVKGAYLFGNREITIDNASYPISTTEKRNMVLLNMSYCSIYFNNDTNTIYKVLYRIGDTIYLDRGLEDNLSSGSTITVLYKKFIPILASKANEGSTALIMEGYPRFDTGGYLIDRTKLLYKSCTLTMFRDSTGFDNLLPYIGTDEFVKVDKVYYVDENSNQIIILSEGVDKDYTLIDNGTVIAWTEQGKLKIPTGSKYYVDLTKKLSNSDLYTEYKYYVKSISQKYVYISPALTKTMVDGSVFDYTTDIFRLLPYEIADCGTITVSVSN